jgi:hypothetical protein
MKPFLLAVALALVATGAASKSLCTAKEQVVFACQTRSAKAISLCIGSGGLTYRFGTDRKVELEVRDPGPFHPSAFQYFHYFRAGADRSAVEIRTRDAQYTVFAEAEKGERASAGVEAAVGGDRSRAVVILCAGPPEAQWSRLAGRVACSAEPLNACVEPLWR